MTPAGMSAFRWLSYLGQSWPKTKNTSSDWYSACSLIIAIQLPAMSIIKNVFLIIHMTWLNLKIIMLDERSQIKNEYIVYDSIYQKSRKCKFIYSDRKQISSCLRLREGLPRDRGNGLEVMNMFIILSVVMPSQVYI